MDRDNQQRGLPSPRLPRVAVEAGTNLSEHLLCAQSIFSSSPSWPREAAVRSWRAAPLLPGRLRDEPGWAEVTQLVDAGLALGLGHWSLQQKPETPLSVLTALPPRCLSKNLEEYFWNEVSNTPSHFY